MSSNKDPIKKETPDFVVEHNIGFKKRYDNEILVDKSTESDNTNVHCPREHEIPIRIVLLEHNLWKRSENATHICTDRMPLTSSNKHPVKKVTLCFVVEHDADFKKRYDNEIPVDKSMESNNTIVPYPREHEIPSPIVLLEHNLLERGVNATHIRVYKKPLMSNNNDPIKKATFDFVVEHDTGFKKRYDNEILVVPITLRETRPIMKLIFLYIIENLIPRTEKKFRYLVKDHDN